MRAFAVTLLALYLSAGAAAAQLADMIILCKLSPTPRDRSAADWSVRGGASINPGPPFSFKYPSGT